MNSTVYIYVNSIACCGPRYICKCKRHDNVRYECITNGLFSTLAAERICSAVLLNCTKARIEPLFELNRTAASVASSNNGMPTFSTPSTQKKKIPAECWRAKKIIYKRILEKKNFIVNQGVEKTFHNQTKSPTPPPQKSNGRPLNDLQSSLMPDVRGLQSGIETFLSLIFGNLFNKSNLYLVNIDTIL